MKIVVKFVLCLFSVILISCSFSATFQDELDERNKAEKVVDSMYRYVNLGDMEKSGLFFSTMFYSVTNESELYGIFSKTKEVLGVYQDKTLVSWKTRRVEGASPSSEYLLVYNVRYSKYNADETFRLKKEGGAIKIVSYNVNSKGFLK